MRCLGDSLTGVHPRRISRPRWPTKGSHVGRHLAAAIPPSAVLTVPTGHIKRARLLTTPSGQAFIGV